MKTLTFFITGIFIFLLILLSSQPTFAAGSGDGLGCGEGFGPLAAIFCGKTDKQAVTEEAGNQLNRVMSVIIGVMTIGAGLFFLSQLLLAGYGWIGAGGDEQALETARHRITYGLVGLIIVVASWVIVAVIGKVVGLNITNPGSILQTLSQ